MNRPRRHAFTAALVLATLAACTPAEEPAPTPTPTSSSPAVEPSPTPSVSYPGHEGAPPPPPTAFGKWRHHSGGLTNAQFNYDSADGVLVVGYVGNTTASKAWVDGKSTVVGNWVCKIDQFEEISCHTDAWEGEVSIFRSGTSKEELAAIGDEFMKAWK